MKGDASKKKYRETYRSGNYNVNGNKNTLFHLRQHFPILFLSLDKINVPSLESSSYSIENNVEELH